ncbi:uncharacterized protein LOC128712688 [Anopheles marshallii]|uniref:uncharacterized protein LOC128712688 n=1 Tax=Anopheles marshallii TaxID=1521116 RepID=UPI00237BCC41|nr:uncharacterized protein LOC128712688 [Anopheles marshallii]
MEDPLDQRSVIKGIPTPQSMEASVEIKQEPELDMELLLQASPWDFNIKDPLKNEIEIGETRVTTQDPFSMIQQTAIKSEPKAEENEGTEDYSHHNDSNISDATSDTSTTKEITPVNSKEELDKLEEFLNTDNNMQSMAERLNRLMSEQDVVNRLSEALYIVVNDKFLTQCSWLGSKREERKIGLKQYVNLQNLIQRVAENGVHKLESDEFQIFLKLKIFHAKERLRSKNMRKNVCRFKKFDIKSNEETNSLDPFFDAVSITEIIPVTSKEELARLERFLNTESNMQSMVERVSSSLTSDDVVNRMNDAFHQVLKVEFVTKVSWYGVSNRWGKIALRRYVNFLSLLQCVVEDGVHSLTKVEFERILKSTIHSAKRNLHSANLKNSVCKFTNGHSNSTSIQETNSSDPVMETESAATITPVNSKEELDKLEEFLNTDNNMQSMAERLNRLMSGQDVVNRLSEALYIVVNDEFLVQCSWLGSKRKERKIGLKQYVNLQNLLHCVAEAGVFRLEKDEFERILKSKIFHAKERLSQSVCGLKKFCTKSDEETHSLDPFFDAVTFTEIIPVTSKKDGRVIDTESGEKISPIVSKEELDKLEEFLNADNNMQSMVRRLSSLLTADDAKNRLSEALYIVVSNKLLSKCRWLGTGKDGLKIPFKRYMNLQKLLRLAADGGVHNMEKRNFETILKLKIFHAKRRLLNFKNMRKSVCRFRQRKTNSASVHKTPPIDSVTHTGKDTKISLETRCTTEIFPSQTRASKQISLEARASSTKISPGAGSNSIISDIKSKEELDKLEEYLNTENNMQSMAKRLNRLMSAQDVENRFNEALNLVVGVGFLTKCSWVGSRLTIGLQKYVNFQSLLRLLAEDSVHTLRKADLEKFFKMNINHAKGRKRTKQQK